MAGKIQNQIAKQADTQKPAAQSVNQIMNSILDGEKMRSRFDDLLGRASNVYRRSLWRFGFGR